MIPHLIGFVVNLINKYVAESKVSSLKNNFSLGFDEDFCTGVSFFGRSNSRPIKYNDPQDFLTLLLADLRSTCQM